MNISNNYQLGSVNFTAKVRQIKNLPIENSTVSSELKEKAGGFISKAGAAAIAATALSTMNRLNKGERKEAQTIYGPVVYTPKGNGEKSSFVVSRPNGNKFDLFKEIPQEVLESPVMEHVTQVKCSTINPKAGIVLIQNQANNTVTARVIDLTGTLEDSLVNNNMQNIPLKYDMKKGTQYQDTPWSPGRQDITQKCLQVTYGIVKEDWGALPSYMREYGNDKGEAPDIGTLAAQKGTEDRSFMPANIAKAQYEIVTESGERIPCDYEEMVPGVDYNIAKKGGVELKMAVPPVDVISSEGENLPANVLYMVDSMGHFYNGQPIKRIKSGEVSWNTDMNDPVQANIKKLIDESARLESESKSAKKAGNTELSGELSKQAKSLHKQAEKEMTEWVKSAQTLNGVEFFA